MLIRTSIPGFRNRVYQTVGAIIVPMFDAFVPKHQNILAVLARHDGKLLVPAANIVTDAGDTWYAQSACGETPDDTFAIVELGSAGTPAKDADRSDFTPIGSTQKAFASGYPKSDDDDEDNTGAGADIVSFLAEYGKADFNHAAITHGWITTSGASGSEALLTGFAFASGFEKTADDTLKVFINHTITGA